MPNTRVCKPAGRLELNRAFPLASDIEFAWVPDLYGFSGNQQFELVRGLPGATTNLTAAKLISSPVGKVLDGSTGDVAVRWPAVTPFLNKIGPLTFAVLMRPQNAVAYKSMCGKQSSSEESWRISQGANSNEFLWAVNVQWYDASTTASSAGVDATGFQMYVGTWDLANIRFYIAGSQVGSAAFAYQPFVKSNDLFFWLTAGATQYGNNSIIAGSWVWGRALTASEIATFSANPWLMFAPRARIFLGTAASATTSNARLAQIAGLEKTATAREAQRATLEATMSARVAQRPTLQASDSARLAQGATALEKGATARLVNTATLEATVRARIAQLAHLEAVTSARVAQGATTLDKALAARLAQLVSLEATGLARLAQGATALDKSVSAREAQVATLEAATSARLAQILTADKAVTARVAQSAALDKITLARLSQIAGLEAATAARLAQGATALDKATSARVAQIALLQGGDNYARIAQAAALEAQGSPRVANLATLEAVLTARLAQTLTADKKSLARLAQAATLEARVTARLAQAAALEAVAAVRIGQTAALESAARARLSQTALLEAVTAARLTQIATLQNAGEQADSKRLAQSAGDLDKAVVTRLAQSASLEDTDSSRAAQIATLAYVRASRLAQGATPQAAETARLAQAAALQAVASAALAQGATLSTGSSERVAQLALLDQTGRARLSHRATLEDTDTARLSQTATLAATASARVAQILTLAKEGSDRLAQGVAAFDRTELSRLAQVVEFYRLQLLRELEGVMRDGTGAEKPHVQAVAWPRGEDGILRVTVTGADGAAEDIVGGRARLVIAAKGTTTPILDVAGRVYSAGVVDFELTAAATDALSSFSAYVFDVWIVDTAGKRWQVIPVGSWRSADVVTRPS